MLDENIYNVSALRKMSKGYFYKMYEGKIADIDKVWEWLKTSNKKKK